MKTNILGLLIFTLISVTILWIKNTNILKKNLKLRRDSKVERFENITKSQVDKRSYRGLKLRNNLTALLISDPATEFSAASLAVTVGSINENVPGLAHFLEHMLFMGSKKYPEEDDFMKFISSHAGATNAFTDVDITNFQFQVGSQFLTPTLDRFAQFFIAPLIAPSALEREVMAVDSEHKMYLLNDNVRLEQIEILMSKAKHPFNHFFTGNLKTLYQIPSSKNVSIRDELLKFHSTWYSSNLMNLVVLGKENLNQLEKIVISLFEKVENKNIKPATYSYKNHPWGPEQVKRKIFVVPIANIDRLKLIFPTPSVNEQYKTAPANYLSNLIGHEGTGGLLSVLKKRDLCENSDSSYVSYSGFAFFTIQFSLTEGAVNRMDTAIDEIITLTFQYIQLLKAEGIQERFFEENKKTNEIAFTYKDKESPLSYAVALSSDMHNYPIEDILSYKYLCDSWRPTLIKQYLAFLTPYNMNVFIISKSFEKIADETEPWYGTKYKIDTIPDSLIEKWKTIEMTPELQLPPRNDFVTENFSIYPLDKHNPKDPYIIQESSISRIWFKQDDQFKLPKLAIRFEILSPISSSSPSNRNMLELFVKLFSDSFNEYAYAAGQARLQWSISPTDYGICVQLFGFNEKLPSLLEMLILNMTNFKVDETRFKILKELYIRDLKNFEAAQLYIYANERLRYLIQERQWTKEELLAAAHGLQSDNEREFISKLLSRVYIQGLIHGNFDAQEVKNIVDIVEKPFKSTAGIPTEELSFLHQVQLDDGSNMRYEISNAYHPTSCLHSYYQCSTESALNNSLIELFVQIISEPCFNVLRTQEQLGYVVFCAIQRGSGVQGLIVTVESEKHPLYVDSRVEAFLRSIQVDWVQNGLGEKHSASDKILDNMTDNEFEAHKTALATRKLEKPKQLDSLSNNYWYEIGNRLYNFERQEKEVKQLRSLKKADVLDFYKKHIQESSSKRRKLAINVVSEVTKPALPTNNVTIGVSVTKIDGVAAFRNTSKFLPLPAPYMKLPPLGTKPE